MHGHLVAVEVGVERGADQRMDADGFSFDERGLESLDAQAVQRGSAIEQHGMLADHVFEDVPDDRFLLLDHFLGLLDGGAVSGGFELVVDERLEQFERHFFRQPALVEPKFRADNDDRTARVIHALAEQVLAEAALLALEGIGEGLERAIVGAAQHAAAAAIIEQGVDGLLQHALFIAHDDVGGVQLHELLEAVIAVDDAPVEVVEIGGGEAAAVQRHQGAQFGREHRDHVQNHPLRLVAALAEGVHDAQALGVLDALLQARVGAHLFAQLVTELVDIDLAKEFLDGFGAHHGAELSREFGLQLAVFFLGQNLALLDARHLARVHDDEGLEVQDALEIAHGNIQQVADPRGQALEEPDMRAGRSQLDVSQAFAADFAQRDFDAALIADDAAVLHALVFAAQAFPVGNRAEDLGAEQAVALRLEGAVVDGFRFGHFAVRPGANFLGARQADADGIEISD